MQQFNEVCIVPRSELLATLEKDDEKWCEYEALGARASGEMRKLAAIREAKERGFKPAVVELIEQTEFHSYVTLG